MEMEQSTPFFDLAADFLRCEREFLRLLLTYAPLPLGEGVTVAAYLLDQVSETPFRTPLYADLLHVCREAVAAGQLPDARALTEHERGDIRDLVLGLVEDARQLSPNWMTMFRIAVPREQDQLQQACDNAILQLNKVNVEQELNDALAQMQALDPADIDAYLAHMASFKTLKQLHLQIGNLLAGIVPAATAPAAVVRAIPTAVAPAAGLRPLTAAANPLPEIPAETAEALQVAVTRFEELLSPLRLTRPRGHQAIRLLLADPTQHPTVVAQLEALQAHGTAVYALYVKAQQQLDTWRAAYKAADEQDRAAMQAQEPARLASERLRGLRLLYDEANNDLRIIREFIPSGRPAAR